MMVVVGMMVASLQAVEKPGVASERWVQKLQIWKDNNNFPTSYSHR
jgi:hypothetical protein